MLAQQILEIAFDRYYVRCLITCVQIQPLVRSVQIAVGQKHCLVAVGVVFQKVAVVAF